MADAFDTLGEIDAADQQFAEAEDDARTSGHERALFGVLKHRGHIYRMRGEHSESARWYQRALGHVGARYRVDITDVLYEVGQAWQRSDSTPDMALAMYAWVLLLDPHSMHTRMAEYECRLQFIQREVVKSVAKRVLPDDLAGIAEIFAANWALGRRERASAVAEAGHRLAVEAGDRRWQSAFSFALLKCPLGKPSKRSADA